MRDPRTPADHDAHEAVAERRWGPAEADDRPSLSDVADWDDDTDVERLRARLDAARAALDRVRALQREWYGRSQEATSEPLSWRRVSRDLYAALDGPGE